MLKKGARSAVLPSWTAAIQGVRCGWLQLSRYELVSTMTRITKSPAGKNMNGYRHDARQTGTIFRDQRFTYVTVIPTIN